MPVLNKANSCTEIKWLVQKTLSVFLSLDLYKYDYLPYTEKKILFIFSGIIARPDYALIKQCSESEPA